MLDLNGHFQEVEIPQESCTNHWPPKVGSKNFDCIVFPSGCKLFRYIPTKEIVFCNEFEWTDVVLNGQTVTGLKSCSNGKSFVEKFKLSPIAELTKSSLIGFIKDYFIKVLKMKIMDNEPLKDTARRMATLFVERLNNVVVYINTNGLHFFAIYIDGSSDLEFYFPVDCLEETTNGV